MQFDHIDSYFNIDCNLIISILIDSTLDFKNMMRQEQLTFEM